MVGFSSISQHDEPLALRLALEYQQCLRARLPAAHGREVKTMGDGILVEFDSALEATQCAIELQQELMARNRDGRAPGLQVRVGIHVGDVLHRENDVFGDTVNIAARIEPLAEAAGVAISGAVFDQVGAKIPFGCTRLEHAFLKNIDTPMAVYSLELPWHAPPAARVTPFTDRVRESELLGRAVTEAARGRGSIVAISGESGIGKTRLAEEAILQAERRGFRVLRARGFEDVVSGSYAHWAAIVGALLRDAPSPLLYKLCDRCAREVLTLLPELADRLGPIPAAPPLPPGPARLQLFGGIARFLQNAAREGPLVLLLDDLQWADAGSLQLLEHVAPELNGLPVLVLATYRDVELDPAGPIRRSLLDLRLHGYLREVTLARFDGEKTQVLLGAVLGTPDLGKELTGALLEKTGGNPLFVEEVVRSLVEEGHLTRTDAGWHRAPDLRVEMPSTVREVVHRRVARLGREAEGALAAAAVLGTEFDFLTLQEVCGVGAEQLLPLVESALRARLLCEREVAPGRSAYRLGDEHIREVLYSSLSLARRQQYHRRAGETLERVLGNRAAERSSEIARHFRLGDRPVNAAEFFLRAGDRARRISALDEAAAAYRDAAAALDDALARAEEAKPLRELELRLFEALGDVEYDTGKPEEAAVSYRRAVSAADPADHLARARNLRNLEWTFQIRNDYPEALRQLDLAEHELAGVAAEPKPDAWWSLWLEIQAARFQVYYWLSDTARREEVIARVRPAVERRGRPADLALLHALLAGHGFRRDHTITDETLGHYRTSWAYEEEARLAEGRAPIEGAGEFTRGFAAYWHGDFAEARPHLAKGLEYAKRQHHAEAISRGTTYSMLLARRTRDVEETERLIPAAEAAAEQARLPEYRAMALANRAWVSWRRGDVVGVDAPGERALEIWRGLPERYMVDWLALWPMIAAAHSRGQLERAVDLARGLLQPTQEPLPARLRTLVDAAVQAATHGDVATASSSIGRAVDVAQEEGYL